jgi:hypothetical protein
VYDHYRFRAIENERKKKGKKRWSGFLEVDDHWQDHYVDGKKARSRATSRGSAKRRRLGFSISLLTEGQIQTNQSLTWVIARVERFRAIPRADIRINRDTGSVCQGIRLTKATNLTKIAAEFARGNS